jgi:2'-phosphotransferase
LLYAPVAADAQIEGREESHDGTKKKAALETTSELDSATAHALVVKDSDPSHFLIRATQGHSIKTVDSAALLERLSLRDEGCLGDRAPVSTDLPDTVVHGTYCSSWPLILASGGLRRMNRNHVHFATGPSLDEVLPYCRDGTLASTTKTEKEMKPMVISGMRSSAEILIYIDLKKALAAGCPFWRSENGVVLSEGVDPAPGGEGSQRGLVPMEFFDIVVERKFGLGVLWENGAVVQELPSSMKHAPQKNVKEKRKGRN